MNKITRHPLSTMGYDFIPGNYLPKGKDEYYLRNKQNRSGIQYRKLNAQEIEILVRNRNQSDDWNKLLVSNAFNPELVKNCKFYGLVRIGKLEPCYLEYHNLRMPVGIYNSTIISCDIGDNAVIENVNYLSHYILGNDVILVNINEMATTNYAKFGNGILKEGEEENIRIWLELCNENGGRRVLPFSGMLPGDAWLWSRYRTDQELQQKLLSITDKDFDKKRGYYGKVGDRCIIKNTLIIKDVWIGADAYIKGANKLKNLTIHSKPDATTQIGEGCELVNGIINEGCRVFYGVKAVRFAMASHSQLKYGARLINSYLGNNATISCCEVLNSLIFPSHEQHHNNSFLCAALIMGQSNMAAGATIGSNHNSRGADGELVAGRGFWPGLCVSLKHNSKFASFNILAKGDYPAELHIPVPFSLISNQVSQDKLTVMPAYWFHYNMYALARNAVKYQERDKREEKTQLLEFHYLAPDSMQEVMESIYTLEIATGNAFQKIQKGKITENTSNAQRTGAGLLKESDPIVDSMEILVEGWENSKRPVQLTKVTQAWHTFQRLIVYYAVECCLQLQKIPDWKYIQKLIPEKKQVWNWKNVGGQLIPEKHVHQLIRDIKEDNIKGWKGIHKYYEQQAALYPVLKCQHALQLLMDITELSKNTIRQEDWKQFMQQAITTRKWLTEQVYLSREKDYHNPFRNMVYDSEQERDQVLGALEDNAFILQDKESCERFIQKIENWKLD